MVVTFNPSRATKCSSGRDSAFWPSIGRQPFSRLHRAFFGTITAFHEAADKLGHYLGLPRRSISSPRMMKNLGRFVQQHHHIGRNLTRRRAPLSFVWRRPPLMELGRATRALSSRPRQHRSRSAGRYSAMCTPRLHHAPRKETIANSKAELADWERRYQATGICPLAGSHSSAQDFLRRWNDAFTPLRTWVCGGRALCRSEVQRDCP